MLAFFLIFLKVQSLIWAEINSIKFLGDGLIEGPYLIYDCQKHRFACLSEEDYSNCELEKSKRKSFYTCIPLKRFEVISECHLAQYQLIHAKTEEELCFSSN